MNLEGNLRDQKCLWVITGKTGRWDEITKDFIAFANATGRCMLLGIEDGQSGAPADQHIPADTPVTLQRKLGERTVNVAVLADVVTALNGGHYSLKAITAYGGNGR